MFIYVWFNVAFQLQRNILATCPRVTRFKIDWGSGEDAENVPPSANTENESNQMSVEGTLDSSKGIREETMDGPVICKRDSNGSQQLCQANGKGAFNVSSDSNGGDIVGLAKTVTSDGSGEPMQM